MTETNSVYDTLRNTRVSYDTLRGHKAAYLYYNDEKVGKMEYRISHTPYQGDIITLVGYSFTPEYMELFKGEESPIQTITNYFRTLVV
jgi:hypothetical protein